MATLWWSLRRASKAQPGLLVPLLMVGVLAADAWSLSQFVHGPDWQLAGVAACALTFVVITTIWCRGFSCGSGAALVMTLLHTGLLVYGRDEHELLRAPFLLALLAPQPLCLIGMRRLEQYRWLGTSMAVIGCVGMCVGAVLAC